jgi:hypothetical protein
MKQQTHTYDITVYIPFFFFKKCEEVCTIQQINKFVDHVDTTAVEVLLITVYCKILNHINNAVTLQNLRPTHTCT